MQPPLKPYDTQTKFNRDYERRLRSIKPVDRRFKPQRYNIRQIRAPPGREADYQNRLTGDTRHYTDWRYTSRPRLDNPYTTYEDWYKAGKPRQAWDDITQRWSNWTPVKTADKAWSYIPPPVRRFAQSIASAFTPARFVRGVTNRYAQRLQRNTYKKFVPDLYYIDNQGDTVYPKRGSGPMAVSGRNIPKKWRTG